MNLLRAYVPILKMEFQLVHIEINICLWQCTYSQVKYSMQSAM